MNCRSRLSRGTSLLETFLALSLLSIGLLGLGPLMALSATVKYQAVLRTDIRQLLLCRLEELRGRATSASDCGAAVSDGSDIAEVRGRSIRIRWSITRVNSDKLYSTDTLLLLSIAAFPDGAPVACDILSSVQSCTASLGGEATDP